MLNFALVEADCQRLLKYSPAFDYIAVSRSVVKYSRKVAVIGDSLPTYHKKLILYTKLNTSYEKTITYSAMLLSIRSATALRSEDLPRDLQRYGRR